MDIHFSDKIGVEESSNGEIHLYALERNSDIAYHFVMTLKRF